MKTDIGLVRELMPEGVKSILDIEKKSSLTDIKQYFSILTARKNFRLAATFSIWFYLITTLNTLYILAKL